MSKSMFCFYNLWVFLIMWTFFKSIFGQIHELFSNSFSFSFTNAQTIFKWKTFLKIVNFCFKIDDFFFQIYGYFLWNPLSFFKLRELFSYFQNQRFSFQNRCLFKSMNYFWTLELLQVCELFVKYMIFWVC